MGSRTNDGDDEGAIARWADTAHLRANGAVVLPRPREFVQRVGDPDQFTAAGILRHQLQIKVVDKQHACKPHGLTQPRVRIEHNVTRDAVVAVVEARCSRGSGGCGGGRAR